MATPPALGTPVGTSLSARGASALQGRPLLPGLREPRRAAHDRGGRGFVSAVTPGFIQPGNISSLLITAAILAVPALGMTLAIAMGALDLSVGSLQALTACTVAGLLTVVGLPLSIGATLLLGAFVGLVNGLIVTRLHVPAFVATLGMMSVLRGAALLVTDGQSILLMGQDELANINSGELLGVPIPILIALTVFADPVGRHAPDPLRPARLRDRRQ